MTLRLLQSQCWLEWPLLPSQCTHSSVLSVLCMGTLGSSIPELGLQEGSCSSRCHGNQAQLEPRAGAHGLVMWKALLAEGATRVTRPTVPRPQDSPTLGVGAQNLSWGRLREHKPKPLCS